MENLKKPWVILLLFMLALSAAIGATAAMAATGASLATTALTAQPEAPSGEIPTYCLRAYLPVFVGSGPSASVAAAPQGEVTVTTTQADCNGFPDFNGDGYADLVVGVPDKDVPAGIVTQIDAGIVQVVYGSPAGLNATPGQHAVIDQIWHRGLGPTEPLGDDAYGQATIAGDFNGDGYDDLAVGIPGAHTGGLDGAGAVQVIYGSPDGLSPTGIEEWSRDNVGNAAPEAGDNFGAALTAGDFDGNGIDDLAVGIPGANVGGDDNAGAIHIIYGRSNGLSPLRNELLTQDVAGFPATPAEPGDQFGFALVAADFNGDGVDDLAVGTPYEDNGAGYDDAGAVQIFFGQRGNLNDGLIVSGQVVNPQHWRSDSSAYLEGIMEEFDRFGFALAAADFDNDGYADLAVGIPYETHGSGGGARVWGGAVNVLYGGQNGLEVSESRPAPLFHQDLDGMIGAVETFDLFGWSLAAGHFDDDAYADLAIGQIGDRPFAEQTGSVQVMFGSADGVIVDGNLRLADVDNPQAVDLFGATLHAADFNGDGYTDLAAGAPSDQPTGVTDSNSGSVFVYYSNVDGPQQNVYQNWYPGNLDLRSTPQEGDRFGRSLPGSPLR